MNYTIIAATKSCMLRCLVVSFGKCVCACDNPEQISMISKTTFMLANLEFFSNLMFSKTNEGRQSLSGRLGSLPS